MPRHIFQYPGNVSFSARLFGSRGDALNHRQLVRRRQVTVAGRHRNRFVTRSLLNLLDRGSGHCKQGAKGVPVRVPNVAGDARIFEAGLKP